MLRKCLLFLLLILAVSNVNAVDITNYSSQTNVNVSGWTYHAFIVIDEPGEYVVTANFTNNSLGNDNIVFLIKNTENVTLDCNDTSFTTNTTNWPNYLVYAYNSSNIVVKNLNANWSTDVIVFENVNDSTIENSEIITDGEPIYMVESVGITISGNNLRSSDYGIYIGDTLENSTITGNTINCTYDGNAYGIYCEDYIVNSTITGNTITVMSELSNAYGICADNYDIINSIITGNVITIDSNSESYGICAYDEDIVNSTIDDNTINLTSEWSHAYGIYADDYINESVISGNEITGYVYFDAYGICAYSIDILNSTLEENVITLFSEAEYVYGIHASNNIIESVISGNEITAESVTDEIYGICAYHNNTINSTIENNVINLTSDSNAYSIYALNNITESVISGNEITGTAYHMYGIYADEDMLVNSTIEDNVINVTSYCQLYVMYAASNITDGVISGNEITGINNDSRSQIAFIYADGSVKDMTIEDNVVNITAQSYEAYSIYASDYIYNVSISGNNITASGYHGSYLLYTSNEDIVDLTLEDNVLTIISDYDDAYCIYPYAVSGSVISGNEITVEGHSEAYGIYAWDEDLINSTIVDNVFNVSSADGESACIYSDYNISNTTITGNTFISEGYSDDAYGICAYHSILDCVISGNEITVESDYDVYGIAADDYYLINTTISGNTITLNSTDDYAYGIYVDENTEDSVISGNTITANAYYDAYGMYLDYYVINSTISGNTITANAYNYYDAYGIYFYDEIYDSLISGNEITAIASDDAYGMYFDDNVYDTTVENNVINTTAGYESIGIYYNSPSYNNIILGNVLDVSGNYSYGLCIESDSENSTISGNDITTTGTENSEAFYLYYATNSTIYENNLTSNIYAIYLSSCEDNRFYLNNIDGLINNGSDNHFVSVDEITYNYRGNSYSSILGNYWASFDEEDTDGDGIIDMPYTINSTNDTKPLTERWYGDEIGQYPAPSSSGSSRSGGSSYASDLSSGILSKVIKNAVSNSNVVYGSEIDEGYAEQLRENLQNGNNYELTRDTIIVGGPLANPFAKEYNEQFEIPITNENPGENRGVIQVKTFEVKVGNIIKTYQVIYIAGSDRLGTLAALEYFKTLDELPTGPITVEWTANGPVLVNN